MAKHRNTELWLSLLIIILISLAYALIYIKSGVIPSASALEGHLLGIVGFLFMLITEVLYSLRKRLKRAARWGRMEYWLQFHVITGLVGPCMVLLHTSWKFNGLAGVVTLLTLLIVISGIIGRYLYTAVPRTPDGVELNPGDLESLMTSNEAELLEWHKNNATLSGILPPNITELANSRSSMTWPLLFGHVFSQGKYRYQWWRTKRHLKNVNRDNIKELEKMLIRRRELRYKVASWSLLRRALALWHSVHVPLGIVLFTTAFIHIGAAIFYVTLRK